MVGDYTFYYAGAYPVVYLVAPVLQDSNGCSDCSDDEPVCLHRCGWYIVVLYRDSICWVSRPTSSQSVDAAGEEGNRKLLTHQHQHFTLYSPWELSP